MERDIVVADVQQVSTRSGATRYVVRDADGNEYTTFRERIGDAAGAFEGKRAHIAFHEEQRGNFTNVYLDAIGPAAGGDAGAAEGGGEDEPDQVGWGTAVEAAPWLLGTDKPTEEIPPDELFEKLEPFKRRVADDIREGGADSDEEER
ncbi:MAG TPA: hypothetical protein VN751_10980 [Solirubrobacteraceae bacterium]|nr:hypothetical protein [Solirubrobacteraceae bacterium]